MSPTAATNKPKMTEAEFLDAQAADARAAIHETWNELKGTLRDTATLEVWARRHPWIVAGTAVAGGFLIATTVLRPKNEEPNEQAEIAPRAAAPRRGSNWLIETLFSLLKPVLGHLVTAFVGATMGTVGGSMSDVAGGQGPDGQKPEWPNAQGNGGPSGEGPVPS